MRIAVVAACPFPWPRGTPIRIHRMAEALGQRGHDVHVVTYHLGTAGPHPHITLHRIKGASWYSRTVAGPSAAKLAVLDPLLTLKLRRVLRELAIDVIHAHHYEGLLAAVLANDGRGPPIVFDAHTLLETELPQYGLPLLAKMTRRAGALVERHLPRHADHVIAVSPEIATRLTEAGGLDPARVSVITNGVEIDHFRNGNGSNGDRKSDVLAFAGNLAPYQRIDLLLRSFAHLLEARPNARLEILTGDDFSGFASLVRELGIGHRVDVIDVDYETLPGHLAQATVLANPRTECSGIPQKLLNYMASGTPTVSFAGSGRLLEHGRTGLIVDDEDVQGFATAALRLMDDAPLGASLGLHAQETAASDHSWQQVAARVEQVYAQAIGER